MKEQRSAPRQGERLTRPPESRSPSHRGAEQTAQLARLALREGGRLSELSPGLLERLARELGNSTLLALMQGGGPESPRLYPAEELAWPPWEGADNSVEVSPPRLCDPPDVPGRDGLWPPPVLWRGMAAGG